MSVAGSVSVFTLGLDGVYVWVPVWGEMRSERQRGSNKGGYGREEGRSQHSWEKVTVWIYIPSCI